MGNTKDMDRIGKYILQGELGKGAMGVVYKGLDPYIERPVAVKTIRFDLLSDRAEQEQAQVRFMREARSAGNLSHPNIVTIYEVGEDKGLTYIAMEYVDGQSLEDILMSGKKLALAEIVNLVARVADALDYAHRKGVIHRDIKPGNILIDKEGVPHIVDFGIARLATSTLTLTRTVMGTPFYMSPEQIAGKSIDHRTDIFSLGTILYELLTEHKPFPGESLTPVIYKIMNEHPPPARTYKKDLPEGFDRIINLAIAKDPEARYQRCSDLARDLRRLISTEPLPERPFQKPEPELPLSEEKKTREASRDKRRKALLLVLAGMMLAVAAIIIFLYDYSIRGNLPRFLSGRRSPAPPVASPVRPEQKKEETPAAPDTKQAEVKIAETRESAIQEPLEKKPPEKTTSLPEQESQKAGVHEEKPRPEPTKAEIPSAKEGEKKAPLAQPPKQPVKEEKKRDEAEAPPPVVPEGRETVDLDKIFEEGVAALKAGSYDSCIRSMEEILKLEPDHKNALHYLAIAKKRKEEEEKQKVAEGQRAAQIARHLKTAEEMWSAKDYKGSLAEAREVLRLDPDNGAAKEYVELAFLKLAPLEIRPIIDEYVSAIAEERLLSFYETYCSADLYQAISKDTALMLKLYDNLRALASQVGFDINREADQLLKAEVRFTQIMTGVSTVRQRREVLFEGTIIWKMEKRDRNWKILNITYLAADRKAPEKEAS